MVGFAGQPSRLSGHFSRPFFLQCAECAEPCGGSFARTNQSTANPFVDKMREILHLQAGQAGYALVGWEGAKKGRSGSHRSNSQK